MNDLENLKTSLTKAKSELIFAEKFREEIIEKELQKLDEIIEYLGEDSIITQYINGEIAYLIYTFESNKKRTISEKVFYCRDKKVRYQVYKKEEYLGYNPTATFEGSYAVVEAKEMFKNIDLGDVLQFLSEQVVDIPEKANAIVETSRKRGIIFE